MVQQSPLVAAVSPIIQDVITSKSVTPITTSASSVLSASKSSADAVIQDSLVVRILSDRRLLWLLGGAVVGFYFGFRIGVVSGRAKRYIASKQFMRAAALSSYDGVKAVTLQSVEVPAIVKDTEILIEVRAASLDPVDLKVSHGFGRGLRDLVNRYNPNVSTNNFPVILGRDGAGLVSQVGSSVDNLREGDRVWFVVPYCVQGSLSNYLVLDKEFVRKMPDELSFEGGATLPYVGMVCWDMLVTLGGLGPYPSSQGKTVFIWGGVRALERLSVQLCALWGCKVTCVAPTYTQEYLLSLGAFAVIGDDMVEINRLLATEKKFDVVMNTGGLLSEELCLSLTEPESGRVVSALVQPPGFKEYGLFAGIVSGIFTNIWKILKYNLIGMDKDWKTTNLDGSILDYLAKLVADKKIDPVGERIFTLDQAELAFRSLAAGGHKGKLVIRMTTEDVRSPAPEQQLALRR